MASSAHVILEALEEARVLQIFSAFYEKYSTTSELRRIRSIYSRTDDPLSTTATIASRDFGTDLSPKSAERLYELAFAFLHKSAFRKQIPTSEKIRLLVKQDYSCTICGCSINEHAHADHIVPFKYVGDELEDNLQMLCSKCNTKKNADLFYEIKHLLGLL